MAARKKLGKYPPLNLDPIDLRTRLALLKMGKFDLAFKKPKPRRPR